MSAVTILTELCNGCGNCLQSCPTDVFDRRSDGIAYVRYPQDCHVCFLCQDDCPVGAIKVDYKIKNNRVQSIYDLLNIAIDAPPDAKELS
jgi:NAD-dependent dihydropyrimidine dehydrogenase PreA subunit